jgi:EAL domain-containing protein (putative c-di-GMP-specific phosphodiesterase class I)
MVNSACDAAKTNGRNRVYVSQPNDLSIRTQQGEMEWIPRLFKALQEDSFVLYYQPIIPLIPNQNQGGMIGDTMCEVLLRLKDEENNIVPPNSFIPIAEKYGFMNLIDRWVIRTLFNHIKAEKSSKTIYSVNISGASLNDDQFLDFIQAQFHSSSISPTKICFEITETLAISNINQAVKFIHQLKSMGCYFALDDFGSGMSSFGYLKNLPLNLLKIDGLFIKDMMRCNIACEIVEAINRIAHVMKIQTIAEHVENQEILNRLKDLHIDYAQGYGIAKPSPISSDGKMNYPTLASIQG